LFGSNHLIIPPNTEWALQFTRQWPPCYMESNNVTLIHITWVYFPRNKQFTALLLYFFLIRPLHLQQFTVLLLYKSSKITETPQCYTHVTYIKAPRNAYLIINDKPTALKTKTIKESIQRAW
jgi:hypothetical protein